MVLSFASFIKKLYFMQHNIYYDGDGFSILTVPANVLRTFKSVKPA